MDFQLFHLRQQLGLGSKERGDDHQGAQRGRDALAEIHGGQGQGREMAADEIVDQCDGRGIGGQEREQDKERMPDGPRLASLHEQSMTAHQQAQCQQGNDPDIAGNAEPGVIAMQAQAQRGAKAETGFQCQPALRNQMIPGFLRSAG